MKIKDILAKGQPTLSFEVFPPKEESNFASVEKAALEIAKLNPSFMSVTYGAASIRSRSHRISRAPARCRRCHI